MKTSKIQEGKCFKGGTNNYPTVPRPKSKPVGQSINEIKNEIKVIKNKPHISSLLVFNDENDKEIGRLEVTNKGELEFTGKRTESAELFMLYIIEKFNAVAMKNTNPDFVALLKEIQKADIKIFIAKNTDYRDSFRDLGLIGILTRSLDKLKRAIQVLTANELKIDSETVRDTMNDLRVYCLMNEGLWREIEEKQNSGGFLK